MRWHLYLPAAALLLVAGCDATKDENPLTTNDLAPTLQLLGFEADTLVYVRDKSYPFEFVVTDDGSRDPQISASVVGNTGEVTIQDKTSSGLYRSTFKPFQKGGHIIEVSATDGINTTPGEIRVFMGDNNAPVAVIEYQQLSRDIPNRNFTYEFDGSKSLDKDSPLVKAIWDLDGTVVESTPDQKLTHTFNYYADYKIELTVEDQLGATNKASITIDNSLPLASFAIRPAAEARNGEQVTLDASGSFSPHADIASYKWLSRPRGGGLNVLAEVTQNIFRYDVSMPVGNNAVGLVVQDAEGNTSDSTWVTLSVVNQPPEVEFSFTTALEKITVTANPTRDIDAGDSLSFAWFLNGARLTDQDDILLPVFDVRGDLYQLTLTATDNHGASASANKNVSVPGVPEAHFVFPDSVEDNFGARNGRILIIDGRGSIAGNESRGIDDYTWFLRPAGQPSTTIGQGRANSVAIDMNHPLGEYEVGLKVTNSEGSESNTTWKNMVVLNSDPTADFTCEFQAFQQAIVYRIQGNDSSDPDPDDTLTYQWFLDGVEQTETVPTPTFTRSHTDFVTTITLRVSDSHGGSGEKSVDGACNQ